MAAVGWEDPAWGTSAVAVGHIWPGATLSKPFWGKTLVIGEGSLAVPS